ncbi:MAG TPA: PAS domain S-box protein [Rubrobacter sp.]|nr:PAS domain S-box protein [Rubrobacter sp.]
MLVEDSDDDALLILRELERAGYDVEHQRVYTAEAMEEALRSSWGVIISDYRMPRFSAMEAMRMANASPSDAPFIVVSGRIGEDVAVEAMRGGAYDYVMKSNLSRLPQTVERGLEKAEERRQRRKVEDELERRDAILDAVRFAADHFLGEAAGWEESIRAVLGRLGEATEASRVYVFENYTGGDGELWATQRYEWVAPGISAQIDNPVLEGLPYKAAGFGRWIQTLGHGDLVHGHVRDLPESEQPELRAEEILSIALVPIFVEGRWWGFIGFDECVQEREWSAAEIGALGAAAGTLGAAIRRRQTEERLRGSEERYRAVIEQATDGIYLLDVETRRFVETNPSFRRMFGYTAQEVGEMDIYDLVAHPREDVDTTIRQTLRSGRRIVGERKYRRKDGDLLDVEVGVSVISLDGRDVVCTIVRDVTERKRNEEALRGSEAELRALFEAMTDLIFVIDGEGRHLKVALTNPALLYRSHDETLGHTLHELFPKEQADEFLGHVRSVLSTRRSVSFEYSLPMELGEKWFEGTVSPMLEDSVVWVARDITERKKSEEALTRSESRLRQIIETEPECVKVLGTNGSLLEMNPAGLAMIEAESLEQVRGRSVYRYIAPDHREAFVNLTEKVLRGGSGTLEFELVGLKGTRRWLDTHAVPLRDAGGEAAGLLAITRDITQRKEAEKRLRDAEFKYRTLVERIPATIYIQVPRSDSASAYTVTYMSPQVEKLLGHPAQRFVEDPRFWNSVTHPDDLQRMVVETGRTDRTGEPFALEYRMLHADGDYRWIRDEAVLVRDEQGNPMFWQGVFSDVTERKRAEDAMQQSERLYRTVIEQATENIFLIDVESRRIVESNHAFREALGYSEEELHRMTLYDVVAADPESVDINLRRTLKEGRASVGERRYRRKDGTLLDVEAGGSVIVRDGRQTLVAVAHDITERARAQHMLEERVATLSGIAGELTLDRPTETVLGDLARSVVKASTAVACGVVLIGDGEGAVHLFGSYGLPENYTAALGEAYRAGVRSPSLEAYRSREPVLVHGLRARILGDPLYAPVHRYMREVSWDVVYSLPLVSRGSALGAIFFCFPPAGEPGEDEKIFLRAVADQAAVAVENARLFSEARGKAALEERQRLARELHDSVSQALYGIALGVETARELLPDHPERAEEPLDYATTLAEAGMTEMRALIFELRPESLEKEGLVAALEKQAAAVQARHGIKVEAEWDREPEATLEVKEALYRVAQEALHNTVKHARATNVKLKLEELPDVFTLGISDDGLGFEPHNDFPGHLGLKSMRERAARLGGTLEVTSEPGHGVRILVSIPR